MSTLFHSRLDSHRLPLDLYSNGDALVAIVFGSETRTFADAEVEPAGSRHRDYECQLREYLEGRRRVFALPLDPRGTDFQKEVWKAVAQIPYGHTASYGEIAHLVGRPRASRAVGAANGANPIPIVIPCHRVIGSDGSLTGYGGGLPLKRRLLALEGVLPSPAVQIRLF